MSREAWGAPPDPPPVCCPECGQQEHSEGCYVCALDAQRIALQSEVARLRARVLELEAVHEDASGAILAERQRIEAAVHAAWANAENCEGDGPEVDEARKAMAATIIAAVRGMPVPKRAGSQADLFQG